MGVISRKVLPACGHMCVCCPALRSRSRQPVKRYKKLLAEIFPKYPDGSPNERKVLKLCEYAVKNPFRIPKIVEHLEQRIHKELKNENIMFINIAVDAYNKLLGMCKIQMPYFAISLLNVVEILENTKRDDLRILGSEVLTRFVYSQVDSTYAHNIESLVPKVCMAAREVGDEHSKRCLRASSLQCISSMIWFMAKFSQFFTCFDDIVLVTLDNYEPDGHLVDAESGETHHNWVDEVVRSEARGAAIHVTSSDMIIRSRPEKKYPALLTREEIETPKVWVQICIQNMSELVKESTTIRRVLDPMFIYFDIRRQWNPRRGLAIAVLSDLFYFTEGSGSEQSILAAIIRHLDHKNVSHDPEVKSDIIRMVSLLARQFRSANVVVEVGIVNDLFRHLRKNLQASLALTGEQEINLNILLQNSIEDCLLEMAKGVRDAQALFDMMTLTLEKPTVVGVAARVTFASMLVLAHIVSLASSCSHSQQVFPEALLLQLLKIMIDPDSDARIIAHQIFCVLLVPKHDYHAYEPKRYQTKSGPAFASAVALLEKLRREKDGMKVEKHEDDLREERGQGWIPKRSPNFGKLNSITDGTIGLTVSADTELNIIKLSEDQTGQLLSAFWIQACLPDNMPSNFEAISHSFNLTLISSHLRNSSDDVVQFFQLSLSLRNVSLVSDYEMLPPSCQRSLFVLATAMMMSTAVIYHVPGVYGMLKSSVSYDVDPYVGIDDDHQLYVKSQEDITEYRSATYNQASLIVLSGLREHVYASDAVIFDTLVRGLSGIMELDKDDLAKQLSETFRPDCSFLPTPHPSHVEDLQALSFPGESLSFDGDFLANGTIDDDAISEPSVAELSHFIPKVSSCHSLGHVIGAGQLLESAREKAGEVAGTAVSTSPLPYGTITSQCDSLGACTRKKFDNWLDHDLKPASKILLNSPANGLSMIRKISSEIGGAANDSGLSTEPWLTMRLPPSSPFDNFLRAINRKGLPLSSAE